MINVLKNNTSNTLIYILGIAVIFGCVFLTKKITGGDETISYLCAAGNQESYQQVINKTSAYGTIMPNTFWQSYFLTQPNAIKNIAPDLVKTDLHPPLFFWLLHYCSLITNMPFKSGLLLNMLLHIAGLLILKSITKQLKLNPIASNFVLMMWVFSPAIISVGFWARQYELLAFINLITLYCYLKTYNNKTYLVGFAASITLGLLTHYLFLYFSIGYLVHSAFTNQKNSVTLKLLLAFVIAFVAFYIIHPDFVQQFELQQQRAQTFNIRELPARLGKTLLAFLQIIVPVLALKPILTKLPFVITIGIAGLILLAVGVLFIKQTAKINITHARNTFTKLFTQPIAFLLMWSLGLAVVPYLFFLTPFHAMAPQYLTLVYPFLLLNIGFITSAKSQLKQSLLVVTFIGCIIQLIVFWQTQKQFESLITSIRNAKLIGVNTVDRRGITRLFPYLNNQGQLIIDEELIPEEIQNKGGVLIADEFTKEKLGEFLIKSAKYDFGDGTTLYVVNP